MREKKSYEEVDLPLRVFSTMLLPAAFKYLASYLIFFASKNNLRDII